MVFTPPLIQPTPPIEEARDVYVEQSDLASRLRAGPVVLWDVGLGAAANALAMREALLPSRWFCRDTIVAGGSPPPRCGASVLGRAISCRTAISTPKVRVTARLAGTP